MTLLELKRKVSDGEGLRSEFKRKLSEPEKILKEVVAFANTDGGYLIIGVDDNKTILGIRDVDEISTVMSKNMEDLIAPKIKYTMSIIQLNAQRSVVVYKIFEGKNKPYFLNPSIDKRQGIAYYRYEDKSIQASSELLKIIRFEKKNKKGYLLNYSENNKIAMQMIHKNNSLTISALQQASGMKKQLASSTLTNLVMANVLKLLPRENEDIYIENQIG